MTKRKKLDIENFTVVIYRTALISFIEPPFNLSNKQAVLLLLRLGVCKPYCHLS